MQHDRATQNNTLTTHQKAFAINMDGMRHGTFAEIGAGQEVANWFFRVGGAAGTVAKSISAYDKQFSDAIYGVCERYVSSRRLREMFDHEYDLLRERLGASRGNDTAFFVFANTVAARSYSRRKDFHGWLGVRFQTEPGSPASEIVMHVRMWDKESVAQQEALGVIGVNLIYGAFVFWREPARLIASLLDGLSPARIEVDMIRFGGPAFTGVDNRLMSLQLVEQQHTNAAVFTPDGDVADPSDVLYRKPVLVERGSYRPVTKLTLDLIERARDQFCDVLRGTGSEPVVVAEMTMRNLVADNRIDHADFLARVDILSALGFNVMVSNYARHYRLAAHLRQYTAEPVVFAMGVPGLKELFHEEYYVDLDGGILEAFGRLFKSGVQLHVYPTRDPNGGGLITADTLEVDPRLRHLYAHLHKGGLIRSIANVSGEHLHISAADVLAKIRAGDRSWVDACPSIVAQLIQDRGYFGCPRRAVSGQPESL
jgi:hypothetical protein